MLEFLIGWMTKPSIGWTFIDEVVMTIEIWFIICLMGGITRLIFYIKHKV